LISAAAQLRDAPIPTEAYNFLKKQRELFETRRKNQADAIEFLHQFRADDDFVLRSARRSLGSKNDNPSVTPNSTQKYKLEPGQQPDARAAVYSYALYQTLTHTSTNSGTGRQNNISNDASSPSSPTTPPIIIDNSIPFQYAYDVLELAAKEASKHPLPEDSDFENADHDDKENLERATGDLNNLVECKEQASTNFDGDDSCGDSKDDNNGMANGTAIPSTSDKDESNMTSTETEYGTCNSILIVEGEIDDDDTMSSPKNDCHTATTPFIPFEAFSKLGESLVLESQNVGLSKHYDEGFSLPQNESDDESSIPGHSFMQLGASMMANDLSSTSKDDDPVEHVKQYPMEHSISTSNTATEVTDSQVTMGSTALTSNDELAEHTTDETTKAPLHVCCDEEKPELFEPIADETFESISTPKKSNRNIVKCNMEEADSEEVDKAEEKEIGESKTSASESTATIEELVSTEQPQSLRQRNGARKKKKKKDKFYYPSSSLFVSRQYLSR